MRDAGILDGDLLAVHRTPEAHNGQIVVARLDDEVTVKRFRRNGHLVSLLPENPEFQPIQIDLRSRNWSSKAWVWGLYGPAGTVSMSSATDCQSQPLTHCCGAASRSHTA